MNTKIKRHIDVAMCKLHQQSRKKIVARTDHRDIQLAAGNAFELRHHLFHLLKLAKDRTAELQQLRACGREKNLLAKLFEQRHSRVLFERFYLR